MHLCVLKALTTHIFCLWKLHPIYPTRVFMVNTEKIPGRNKRVKGIGVSQ